MLVNCPRCGFSQPKDKYCAQCGVDMETYKPRRAPIFKRLLSNPASFLVVFILSVLLGYSLTRSLKGSFQNHGSSKIHSFLSHNANSNEDSNTLKEALSPAEEDEPPLSSQKTKPDTQNLKSKTVEKKKTESPVEKEVIISFYETRMIPFTEWAERNNLTDKFNHSDEYSSATLPHFSKIKKSFLEFSNPLDHLSQSSKFKEPTQMDFFYGLSFPDLQNIRVGHRLYLSAEAITQKSDSLHGQLYLQRFWYFKNKDRKNIFMEPPQQDSISEVLNLESDNAFMIIGTLPRETDGEIEAKLAEKPLYKLLKSEEFQKKLTDMTILIEIQDLRKDKSVDSSPQM